MMGKTMKTFECSNCGATAKVRRGDYDFSECGLSRVVLQGIEIIRCDHCGNEDPIIPRMNDLMRSLALAVIGKPYGLWGEDVRFLRKYLGMTAEEFSRYLHVDKTTLSKWETGDDPVGDQSDRLIRLLCLSLGEGLQEKVRETVSAFPQIRKTHRRLRIQVNAKTGAYQYA
jgi:YgiT-type zinc finger domain-containing protein